MLAIYVITTLVTAFIAILILRIFSRNWGLIAGLSAILVLLSVAMTHLYIVNCPFPKTSATTVSPNSFLNVIALQSPSEFNTYQTKIDANKKSGGSSDNEIFYTTELVNSLLLKYGMQASDESLYNYLKQDIAFDKELYAINPDLVLFHQFPEKFEGKIVAADLQKIGKSEYTTKILTYTENVIKSGMNQEHAVPSDIDIQKAKLIFAAIIDRLGKKYGLDTVIATLKNPADSKLDKKTSADILITFSETILATGPETTGLLLRASYAQTNAVKNAKAN